MLLARRLVEAGVRLVTISWMAILAGGSDSKNGHTLPHGD
jgi:hypothetical protein